MRLLISMMVAPIILSFFIGRYFEVRRQTKIVKQLIENATQTLTEYQDLFPDVLNGREPHFEIDQQVSTTIGPRIFTVSKRRRVWSWQYLLRADDNSPGGWVPQSCMNPIAQEGTEAEEAEVLYEAEED